MLVALNVTTALGILKICGRLERLNKSHYTSSAIQFGELLVHLVVNHARNAARFRQRASWITEERVAHFHEVGLQSPYTLEMSRRMNFLFLHLTILYESFWVCKLSLMQTDPVILDELGYLPFLAHFTSRKRQRALSPASLARYRAVSTWLIAASLSATS